MLKEFRDFIARGNVMDMAVGIIIGAAFTGIVKSLVADVINPVIGLVTGGLDFSNWFVALDGGDYPTLAAAREAGAPVLAWGAFLTAVLNFLIVAFVVFLLVRWVNRIRALAEREDEPTPEPEAPPQPTEVELLIEIRDSLKARPVG